MDELFGGLDHSRRLSYVNMSYNEVYIKYFIIGSIILMFFLYCKNVKLDTTKRIRGRTVSFV